MMTNQTDEKTLEYQRKTEALYAADNFKKRFYPADPFDTGVLVAAELLPIDDLVAVMQAVEALDSDGNATFLNTLILHRGEKHPSGLMIRVNPLWLNCFRTRKREIYEYVECYLFEDAAAVAQQRKKIIDLGDSQLCEDLIEAEEALCIKPGDIELIVDSIAIES
ncbi:MAG: hypothetical protein ACBR12_14275 [Microcoleus sp.]